MDKVVSLSLLICILTFAGCGKAPPSSASLNNNNLDRLKNCYSIYMEDNAIVGPKDKEEFVNYLLTDRRAIKRRGRMGITDELVESMFISERDNTEFRVKYGVNGYLNHALIFEEVGVDGMRMVALNPPQELDAETYEKHWNGEIKAKGFGPSSSDATEVADENEAEIE